MIDAVEMSNCSTFCFLMIMSFLEYFFFIDFEEILNECVSMLAGFKVLVLDKAKVMFNKNVICMFIFLCFGDLHVYSLPPETANNNFE